MRAPPIRNLGRALTILVRAQVNEEIMHEDVSAFGAPSECHADVSRGEVQRLRQARRHAKAVAGVPFRELLRQAKKRGWTPRAEAEANYRSHVAHNPFINR